MAMTSDDLKRFWIEQYQDVMFTPGSTVALSMITSDVLRKPIHGKGKRAFSANDFADMGTIQKQIEEQLKDYEHYNADLLAMGGWTDSRTEGIPNYLRKLKAVLFGDSTDLLHYINEDETLIKDIVIWRFKEGI